MEESEANHWLRDNDVRGFGSPASQRPQHSVIPDEGRSGAVLDDGDIIVPWVAEVLARPATVRKLAKLEATGRPERHLFLRIHDSAMPFDVQMALGFDHIKPTAPIKPTHGGTGLWLVPRWRGSIVWWQQTRVARGRPR